MLITALDMQALAFVDARRRVEKSSQSLPLIGPVYKPCAADECRGCRVRISLNKQYCLKCATERGLA